MTDSLWDAIRPALVYATAMQLIFLNKDDKSVAGMIRNNLPQWLFYFAGYATLWYFIAPVAMPWFEELLSFLD